jgi:hypothetical protein
LRAEGGEEQRGDGRYGHDPEPKVEEQLWVPHHPQPGEGLEDCPGEQRVDEGEGEVPLDPGKHR